LEHHSKQQGPTRKTPIYPSELKARECAALQPSFAGFRTAFRTEAACRLCAHDKTSFVANGFGLDATCHALTWRLGRATSSANWALEKKQLPESN
jgi:hypothetical protein